MASPAPTGRARGVQRSSTNTWRSAAMIASAPTAATLNGPSPVRRPSTGRLVPRSTSTSRGGSLATSSHSLVGPARGWPWR
jgi:hypothetical protein